MSGRALLCRCLGDESTAEVVQLEDDDGFADPDDSAPDQYVDMSLDPQFGDVMFVEVSRSLDGPWVLWRVECVEDGAYVTAPCSYADASRELAANVTKKKKD